MPDNYDTVPVDYQPQFADGNAWASLPAPHGVPQVTINPQQPQPSPPYDLVPVDHQPQFADEPKPKEKTAHGRINSQHTVRSGANSSVDGEVFIDHRIPKQFHKYLAIHERTEGENMKFGYPKAHKIATAAEKKAVEADGLNWNHYTKEIDGYLAKIEHERNSNPPKVKLHVDSNKAIHHHRSHNKRIAA